MKLALKSEEALQRAAAEQWKWRGRADSIFAHIPNGGARNPIVGAKLKAQGVLAGMLDNLCLGDVPFFIELKNPKHSNPMAKLSPEQRDIMNRLQAIGVTCYVSSDLDEVIAILEKHDVLKAAR